MQARALGSNLRRRRCEMAQRNSSHLFRRSRSAAASWWWCLYLLAVALLQLVARCDGAISFNGPSQASINEERPNGTLVLTLQVDDLSGTTTFSLDHSLPDCALFSAIADNSGLLPSVELRVAGRLDREARTQYRCRVIARNAQGDSGTRDLTINLIDINDNAPTFASRSATAVVLENAPLGTIVYNATATDADQVSQIKLLCYLAG